MIEEMVTKLQTTSLAQVLRPDAVGVTTINGGIVVADLISSSLSGEIYNLVLPQEASLPNGVFQLVSSKRDSVDGLPILKVEKIILTIRHSTLTALETLGDTIRALLLSYTSSGNAGAITIEDEAQDVEEVGDTGEQQYRLHMELGVTHLATASQALPVAFVYPLSTFSGDPELNGHPRQMVDDEAAVTIIEKSTAGSLDTAIGYVETLIGHTVNGWDIRYEGGELVRQDGHLTTWRERFTLKSSRAA